MGVEELKRALQEREKNELWRNRIIKEEPLLQLSDENRKNLSSRRAKFEQLSKRFSVSEAENQPPKLVRPLCSTNVFKSEKNQSTNVLPAEPCSIKKETCSLPPYKEEIGSSIDFTAIVTKTAPIVFETIPIVVDTVTTAVETTQPNEVVPSSSAVEKISSSDVDIVKDRKDDVSPEISATEQEVAVDPLSTGTKVPQPQPEAKNMADDIVSASITKSIGKVSMPPLNKKRLPQNLQRLASSYIETNMASTLRIVEGVKLGDEFSKPTDATSLTHSKDNETPKIPFKLPADAFQTPIINREHCGVKLRRVNTDSPFPETMLVQFQGSRPLNVRSISAKFLSKNRKESGSYLLITRDRLIVWNADDATVFNKSKASQMAYDILGGKELTCAATKVEVANDDHSTMIAFCRITGLKRISEEGESEESEKVKADEQVEVPEEESAFRFDRVFLVNEQNDIEIVSERQPPDTSVFEASRVIVFDFVTELYVWIGQTCDRSLITHAIKYAEKLKNTPLTEEQCQLFGVPFEESFAERPSWTILRKQTQGIADCIFRFKFEKFAERMSEIGLSTALRSSAKFGSTDKRPWSVPAIFGALSASAMSNRISSMCSENAYFGIGKEEDNIANEIAAELSTHCLTPRDSLQLESLELKISDENVFTENVTFLKLAEEENLELIDGFITEFNCESCYVIQWNYRIEREGIRKLNGDRIAVHDTGRQRAAYFFWLGVESSIKDCSRCALALRKYDKDRQVHIRIESGHEPPVFLNLLNGKMIISGTGSGYFLVIGSSDNLFSAEELADPPEFRSQGAYLRVVSPVGEDATGTVECWHGEDCGAAIVLGAKKLAAHLATVRGLVYSGSAKLITDDTLPNVADVKLLKPDKWTGSGPRLYRIYDNEGEELCCERYDEGINFTFRQADLRDCILVDQKNRLWIWSDGTVRTFELKLANKLWYEIKGQCRATKRNAVVITKGHEPNEFKALFPTWNAWESKSLDNHPKCEAEKVQKLKENQPQYLIDLLHERTRHRTIDELQQRNLPKGFDTKHLERYLSDVDFQTAFGCGREEYDRLPRWKQIILKKEAQLF